MRLSVYHNKLLIGFLDALPGGLSFCYAPEFLAEAPYPISLSLPLQEEPFAARPTERFFDGLLPEEDERARMARYLHVSSTSLSKLLAALAGDCVGNLTLVAPDDDIEQLLARSGYRQLTVDGFQTVIGESPDFITKLSAENRLSIPGAQSKIGLYRDSDEPPIDYAGWYIPQGLSASTHIVKPDSYSYPLTSLNEYLCVCLAKAAGIETAHVTLIKNQIAGKAVLVSRRFDRTREADGFVTRLWQEDLCQALSYSSRRKYELDGGPGFSKILDVLRSEASSPPLEIRRFTQLFIFNYLIGNCDAHAKNYSLQRDTTGGLCLAPAYDLVTTTFYQSLSRNLALGVAGVYSLDKITCEQWKSLCESAHLSWPWLCALAAETGKGALDALDGVGSTFPVAGFDDELRTLSEHLRTEISNRMRVFTADYPSANA